MFKIKATRKTVSFGLVALALVIAIVSVFAISNMRAAAYQKLESDYRAEIANISIPTEIELEIDEEGNYDIDAASEHASLINEARVALLAVVNKLDKDQKLDKNTEIKDGLVLLVNEKMLVLDEIEQSLIQQEMEAEKIAQEHEERVQKEEEEAELRRIEEEEAAKKAEEEAAAKAAEEAERKRAEEAKKKERVETPVSVGSGSGGTNQPVQTTPKPSQPTQTTPSPKNNEPKKEEKPKEEPKKQEPVKPAFGTIVRSNPYNAGSMCDWENGEFYYEWDTENQSWSTIWRYGMSVTNKERWLNTARAALPMPSRDGSPGEKVGAGTIWIYFDGKCY